MARTLKLVKREDFSSDQDDVDLTGYNDGFELADRGWVQGLLGPDGFVAEALTLHLESTDQDDLADILQPLAIKRKEVGWYAGGVDPYGVWLRSQLEGETYGRQAFLRALQYTVPSFHTKDVTGLQGMTLGFERGAWEDTAASSFDGSSVNSVGGTYSFSSNVGDLPARLARVDLHEDSNTYHINQFWLGFRSSRYGTPGNFQPVWSLRKAGAFGADTTGGTTNVDATAKDGYKVITTFSGTETMSYRVIIYSRNVTANRYDQRGQFQVLLRAKMSAGSSEAWVRLLQGLEYDDNDYLSRGGLVSITDTDWRLYPLGVINFPSQRMIGTADDSYYNTLGIEAERVSGAASLEMDCFILIPVNEGFIYAFGDVYGATILALSAFNYADGSTKFYKTASDVAYGVAHGQVVGGLPIGSGIGVLASEREEISVLTDDIDITCQVYQRWENLRGDET